MIAYLKGKVIDITGERIIVESNNIGWEINVGFKTFLEGQEVEMYIHTQLKENDISLWGFDNKIELKLFKLLISISGVGGKTAQTIITQKGIQSIYNAILLGSAEDLKVSGVGMKTAQKIIIEIKDKIENIGIKMDSTSEGGLGTSKINIKEDVVNALETLGYRNNDIIEAYKKLADSGELSNKDGVEDIIKKILKSV